MKKNNLLKKGIILGILLLFLGTSIIPAAGEIVKTQIETDPMIEFLIDSPEFAFDTIHTKFGEYASITVIGEGHTTTVGEATLPLIKRVFEIPQGAEPEITIQAISWETTSLSELKLPEQIYPFQPSIEKTQENLKYEHVEMDEPYYVESGFVPSEIARIADMGEIRGHRFILVEFSPMQYNPSTGELKLLQECDVAINLPESDLELTDEITSRYYSYGFNQMFQRIFDNYGQFGTHVRDDMGYLIIVYDTYYEEIQPLATWKTTMGYDVTVTRTSEIPGGPTKENIYAYIEEAYNYWPIPPSFVLLVGDVPQIPTWTGPASGTAADLYYVTITAGDFIPDIYIGRFPAATEAHVDTMVEKSVEYEQGAFPSYDWLSKAAFIASSDMGGLAEQTHNYVINNFLEPAGYTCDRIYEASGGSTSDIINALDDGRSLCIYSGHGGPGGWGCVPFDQSDINGLTNADMYPFVCSHACSTNPFDQGECFGETWLRAVDKGGLAFWGASASSYWDEDDILEKGMFEAWWEEGFNFLGGMTDEGLFRVYENYSGGGRTHYYYDAYNLNGDPAIGIKPPYMLEHNIAVTNIDVDHHVLPGELVDVEATILNNGQNDEYNIIVSFRVDDIELDTYVIPMLASQSFELVNFQWTPPDIDVYELTINVSIPGIPEDMYEDNEMSTLVIAGPDVAVLSLSAPEHAALGRVTTIDGSIGNLGNSDEWVNVYLRVNGEVIDTDYIFLFGGTGSEVSFDWIPTELGMNTVELAVDIDGEEPYLDNNQMSRDVEVFYAMGYILLVDDDDGDTYEGYYEVALLEAGYLYEVWNHDSQGSPSASTMAGYDAVIWFTGMDYGETIGTQDQNNLITYLNNGGRLFATGQDIGYDIGSSNFYQNYLHANYHVDDTDIHTLLGVPGDPIGDGMTLGIEGGDGANNQYWPDGITPQTPATIVFEYQGSSYDAAVKTEMNDYRVVYFAFGFEAINTYNDRAEIMERVLGWLLESEYVIDPDLSFVTLTDDGMPGMMTCPAGDGSAYQYVLVTVKDTYGAPIQGIPASSFAFDLSIGPETYVYGDLSCTFTSVDSATDENGEIRFEVVADTSITGNIHTDDPGLLNIEVIVDGIPLNDLDTIPCRSPDYGPDGDVDLSDFALFANDFYNHGLRSDFSFDGDCSLVDFAMFAQHYGHRAPRIDIT